MDAIHWLNDIDGSFTNPSDWRGGVVPGESDSAILGAAGSAFTVTSAVDETVRSIRLAANATLSLTAGTFTAGDGTGEGANGGIILVGPGATLVTGGTVTNAGTIALYGAAKRNAAALLFSGVETLTGGGVLRLDGSGRNILGSTRHKDTVLYNVTTRSLAPARSVRIIWSWKTIRAERLTRTARSL